MAHDVAAVAAILRKLLKEKAAMEMGVASFLSHVLPKITKDDPMDILGTAFMCGAFHCHATMISILDNTEEEPTDRDVALLDLLSDELVEFMSALSLRLKGEPN